MLGEIRAMQVCTMTMEIFYAGSQISAMQIRAMRNRASRGMTVLVEGSLIL